MPLDFLITFIRSPPSEFQLLVASTSKKPSDSDLQKILAAMAAKMAEIEKCKDNRSEVKEHLSTIAEGTGDAAYQLHSSTTFVAPSHVVQEPCLGC